MPKYSYALSNGKSLVLEGDTQPTDEEIESIAHEQGVFLQPADGAQGGDLLVDNVKNLAGVVGDVAAGAAKKFGEGATGVGRLLHKIPGFSEGVDALYEKAGVPGVDSGHDFGERRLSDLVTDQPPASAESRLGLEPTNTAQKIGGVAEQALEYAVGGGAARGAATRLAPAAIHAVIPAAIAEGATGASIAALHGDNPTTAGAMSAAIPIVGAAGSAIANASKGAASRFVRAAIKPTVTEMKQTAGASQIGIDKVADRLAQFIIDKRITTPERAQAIINEAENEIQMLVGATPTDAATRSARYLKALERSAAKQGLGADDVATLRGAARELVEGPMGQNVVTSTTTMQPSKILNPQGQPVMVPVVSHQTTRALRPTVPADEALESARSSSRWSTRKAWGEQKGSSTEASKGVERAQRDAVKAAIPETKPIFKDYSKAIKARDVLSRMNFRQNNRDVVGMPTQIIAGQELLKGRVPFMAMASNWLRDNQLKAGIWADKLGSAIKNNDVQTVSNILGRFGVTLGADQGSPEMEQELLRRTQP